MWKYRFVEQYTPPFATIPAVPGAILSYPAGSIPHLAFAKDWKSGLTGGLMLKLKNRQTLLFAE